MKFVAASTGIDVPGASASINMAGCTPGSFVYVALASPIILPPGSSYYLVSLENAGGDRWYDSGAISTKSVASVTHSVYFYGGGWYVNGGANMSYVPPDFLYTVMPPSSTPAFVTTYNLNNAPLRNDFSGSVGMKFTVGATPLDVTSVGHAEPMTEASVLDRLRGDVRERPLTDAEHIGGLRDWLEDGIAPAAATLAPGSPPGTRCREGGRIARRIRARSRRGFHRRST